MYRRVAACLLTIVASAFATRAPLADEPAARQSAAPGAQQLDPNDPLLKALRQLQGEIDQLRRDVRGGGTAGSMQRRNNEPQNSERSRSRPADGASTNKAPRDAASAARSSQPLAPIGQSSHWSFQPLRPQQPPAVADSAWPRDRLDRFLLARLEAAGLKPSPDADRHTLLRRLAFDLTGLPPSEQEIAAFVSDPAPDDEALARVVDRYLALPAFGERWGRHWLDVVRYADSVGRTWNAPFTYAWRYRDYVIDALNRDKPFDRFVMEQVAGDLLPAATVEAEREALIATGFLTLGSMSLNDGRLEGFRMDRVDEQIDVTTRAFLGLSISCARCHDHKYDPVTMRDYYALAGIFYSMRTYSGQGHLGELGRGGYVDAARLIVLPGASADVPLDELAGVHSMNDFREAWQRDGDKARYTTHPDLAMGVLDGEPTDCELRVQGDPYDRGEAPPRGDLRIAGLPRLPNIAADSTGWLELARWIASPANPLTPRVAANRVWQHLFGRGLARTVDDFGTSGEAPTHPELLDDLASRLIEERWSLKRLIRAIVLSRTYRQSSAGSAAGTKLDPRNDLFWRMQPRRLEFEPLRDTMLVVAGQIARPDVSLSPVVHDGANTSSTRQRVHSVLAGSPAQPTKAWTPTVDRSSRPYGIQVAGMGGKGRGGVVRSLLSVRSPYRTVYLPVLRSLVPEAYSTFDFPDPCQLTGERQVTTVAPQALFFMNNDFVAECATDAARRLLEERELDTHERIRLAYFRLLGRPASEDDIEAALVLLESLQPDRDERHPELYRWTTLVQGLMASGEFRYVF